MSYTVLARKYRPQVFADMVGQDHLVKVLTNALASGRVAHAYLFSGPRGVGKTTAARILAKALNCEKGPTPEPCGVCSSCVEIRDGRSLDVLEIDGASNRGINEVRELRENVRFVPSRGRSKVYIIDEVHMLTGEAFNALLKTLEEPPAHVVFVFATTEPFKLPPTILSRCQRFDFARIPARTIGEHLASVMARENQELVVAGRPAVQVAPAALALIARRAQGGLRDALSLLDQILAAVEGPVERESVETFLGLVGEEFYHALVERIAAGDAAGAITLLDGTYRGGADLRDLAEGLAGYLRDLLFLRIGSELAPLLEAPESDHPRLSAQAQRFSRETLLDLVDRAADLVPALRRAETPRLTAELALAEMTEMSGRLPLGEVAARLLDLERRLGGQAPVAVAPLRRPDSTAPVAPAAGRPARPAGSPARPVPAAATPAAAPAAPHPAPAEPGGPADLWERCLEAARAKSIPLASKLGLGAAATLEPGRALLVRPATASTREILRACLAEEGTQAFLGETLSALGHPGVRVALEDAAPTAPAPPSASAAAAAPSAAKAKAGAKGAPKAAPAAEPAKPAKPADRAKPAEGAKPAEPAEPAKPAKPAETLVTDTRDVGQLFKDEPMLQKALDMFDGEVLP